MVKAAFPYFYVKCGKSRLNQGGKTPLLRRDAPLLEVERTTFSDFLKSGRFCRLKSDNLMILPKSGGILPRKTWFLFNYWKVLIVLFIKVFSFFQGPKIASDKVALEPTLFPHGTVLRTRKAGCGTATMTVLVNPIFSGNNDRLQPKNTFFEFYPKSSRWRDTIPDQNWVTRSRGAPRRMGWWGAGTTFGRSKWPLLGSENDHFLDRKTATLNAKI